MTFVRVKTESGAEVSMTEVAAEAAGYKALDKPATDPRGRALLPKYPATLRPAGTKTSGKTADEATHNLGGESATSPKEDSK